MKTKKRIYENRVGRDILLDMCDVKGTLLEKGQTVWYARHDKSRPSELFQAEITKLTTSSVTIKYEDDTCNWRNPTDITVYLISGYPNKNNTEYRFRQLLVI